MKKMPALSNIFVENNYNPTPQQPQQVMSVFTPTNQMNENPSMPYMNTFAQMPTIPPCLSISINRHNEISLNLFNLNQPRSEKQVVPQP